MNTKLVLTVLVLVILPTAVLSLVANRALRSRELVLQYQYENAAAEAIKTISGRISARLEDTLEQVRLAMQDCVSRGGTYPIIGKTAIRLEGSQGLVEQVFVFMNPWGMLWPEMGVAGPRSNVESGKEGETSNIEHRTSNVERSQSSFGSATDGVRELELVGRRLAQEIASLTSSQESMSFAIGEARYFFSVLDRKKDLYVGYRVDQEQLERELFRSVEAFAGKGLVLSVETPESLREARVVVSDSFAPPEEVSGAGPAVDDSLAVGRLAGPFDSIRITAVLKDPARVAATAREQSRLYAWGLILMALGICAGIVIVLRVASIEVRQARSRGDFVIGVSHDLRTPISSMLMLSESLYLDHVAEPEKRKEFLGVIVRECERLSQLIERLLFLVRFGQNALMYRMNETDPGALAAASVQAFNSRFSAETANGETNSHEKAQTSLRPRATAVKKGAKRDSQDDLSQKVPVTLEVENDLPLVLADESAINQVILNLLDNAVKYSPPKAASVNGYRLSVNSGKEEPRDLEQKIATAVAKAMAVKKEAKGEGAQDEGESCSRRVVRDANIEHSTSNIQHRTEVGTGSFPINSSTINLSTGPVVRVSAVRRKKHVLGREREWVRISVADQGIGISRKEQKKIFRKFYRVGGKGADNVSGLGLGLALCRHIVRAHKGWMEVDSRPGQGSTFAIFLPVKKG